MKLLALLFALLALTSSLAEAACRLPSRQDLAALSMEDLMANIEGANDILNQAQLEHKVDKCTEERLDLYSAEMLRRTR
jgi:hypothetical protein